MVGETEKEKREKEQEMKYVLIVSQVPLETTFRIVLRSTYDKMDKKQWKEILDSDSQSELTLFLNDFIRSNMTQIKN